MLIRLKKYYFFLISQGEVLLYNSLDNLDKEPTLLESSLFVDRYIFKDSISKTIEITDAKANTFKHFSSVGRAPLF